MFEPGTRVRVIPDDLWYFDFTSTEGEIKSQDIIPDHYIIKLKRPVVYGLIHKLREIRVHKSNLKELN